MAKTKAKKERRLWVYVLRSEGCTWEKSDWFLVLSVELPLLHRDLFITIMDEKNGWSGIFPIESIKGFRYATDKPTDDPI